MRHASLCVEFSKKINGTYYVVEAVSDAKANYIISAHILAEGKQPFGEKGTKK